MARKHLISGFEKPSIMFTAAVSDMWLAAAFWSPWKLNEVEIYISKCDNTPPWAHGTVIDALEHLISPAGNGKYRENKL